MNAPVALLCLAAALASGTSEQTIHTDYGTAWKEAQARHLPLLVVLNPSPDSTGSRVENELLTRSQHRRDLLANFVVAVIDTSTEKGERVWKQFGSAPLPRVSVIDKNQKLQIHRASAPLVAEDWNLLLEKHRAGLYVPPPPAVVSGPIVSGTIRPLAGSYLAGPQLTGPFVMQSAANCFT
ncbi:MAG: hypothetical protein ACK5EA_25235 [Planctomycetaceae bacterium]|jgi:hypothetical protein